MDCSTPASLSITNSWSLLRLMSIELVMPSNHLILCCPLHLPPSVFPSIRAFSTESALCIRWPKYWSFSFNISPSNEYSGLISFRIDWFDLFAVQGTLKSLLRHHSSKASILRCSAFSIVQLSHPYMTTGKTIALTRQAFVSKVMFLLCNMLSRLVIVTLTNNIIIIIRASQVALVVKSLLANAGDVRDTSLIPGLGRLPGEGHGKPLQYSCLENSMDRGAWQATVPGVAKSQTWLTSRARNYYS